MLQQVHVPRYLAGQPIVVDELFVQDRERIRRGAVLIQLSQPDGSVIPIVAPTEGWVRHICVKTGDKVTSNQLLLIIDVIESIDFKVDSDEFGSHTELGESGRRKYERDGQKAFGDSVKALFEAHQESLGMGQSPLRQHPMMANMKEGVPPKMSSDAANNQDAVNDFVDEATRNPELRKELSKELSQQLNIQPGPSSAPTLTKQ